MENKQTAVSYVLNKLQEEFPKQFKDMYDSNQFLIEDIFLKAKQMEKEQIIDAYEAGEENAMDFHSIPNFNDITAEQYYNETFKQQ
jgi:hypothetical protein